MLIAADADRWVGPQLDGDRLVVIAPHPDDEVLQAGGLIRWWAGTGRPVTVVAVTDGEASHAQSLRIDAPTLRARRAAEREAALAELAPQPVTVVRLGQPDQGCSARRREITRALRQVLTTTDVVVGPAIEDRHPDHVAVARALRAAGAGIVAAVWESPTWALVHGTAPPPSTVLTLGRQTWLAKQRAVQQYGSQLAALGPAHVDGPVVHPHELAAMVRPSEQFAQVRT